MCPSTNPFPEAVPPEALPKLRGYLGLAAKAGRLQSGEDMVVKAVQAGRVLRLFVDAQAGPNAIDRLQRLSAFHGLPLHTVPGLGACLGKPGRVAAALTDAGFDKAIQALFSADQPQGSTNPVV